ncbi:MAG: beta-ribofuranosylaminobenzene 5'-phosphate synthase [Pirellulales bacterium]|nr:beta-ribofuranosylaminobenzene 5'-phosphate synthase [Pirellulales bacterium]
MANRQVEVRAPARLHFGMFGFGAGMHRQFGGIGVMLDGPHVRLRAQPAARLEVVGEDAQRAAEAARRWSTAAGEEPRCRVEVIEALPAHQGLGSGTQLALAVAAALDAFEGRSRRPAIELARIVERGRRSAVGVHGFDLGGLIVEAGKAPGETIAPLVEHATLPADWRIALILPHTSPGLSGEPERAAFADLPPVPAATTAELWHIANEELLPAVHTGDFACFATSVYRFGYLAGECFAKAQGGPYAGPVVAGLIERIRAAGFTGVGQSSWGPGVFVWLPDASAERALREALPAPVQLRLTRPAPCGAAVELS